MWLSGPASVGPAMDWVICINYSISQKGLQVDGKSDEPEHHPAPANSYHYSTKFSRFFKKIVDE
jgi:hypothetical protein